MTNVTQSTGAEPRPRPADASLWSMPHLDKDDRWLGGVASALAVEVGVDATVTRAAFVILGLTGYGVVLYLALWLWFTLQRPSEVHQPLPKAIDPTRRHIGVLAVTGGLFTLFVQLPTGVSSLGSVMSLAVLLSGVVMIWSRGAVDWEASDEIRRFIGGALLVTVGLIALFLFQFGVSAVSAAILVALVGLIAALGTIFGPWLWRAGAALGDERRLRIRADERAAVAAHLHDSVLQTLTLIQHNAGDATATVSLARRQERELREWLYSSGSTSSAPEFLRGAIAGIVNQVEEMHRIPIEVVVVGDCAVDDAVLALLKAAREAMVNAARHSGADRIDVYAEVEAGTLTLFVRDTGSGFDQSAVPADRRGVADSIRGRVERAGGSVAIASEPGEGTEVELQVPYSEQPSPGVSTAEISTTAGGDS